MEERGQVHETRKYEVRIGTPPRKQGFDHRGNSKPSTNVSSRERSLTKAPSNSTLRSSWTEYTPSPAAASDCDLLGMPREHGVHQFIGTRKGEKS